MADLPLLYFFISWLMADYYSCWQVSLITPAIAASRLTLRHYHLAFRQRGICHFCRLIFLMLLATLFTLRRIAIFSHYESLITAWLCRDFIITIIADAIAWHATITWLRFWCRLSITIDYDYLSVNIYAGPFSADVYQMDWLPPSSLIAAFFFSYHFFLLAFWLLRLASGWISDYWCFWCFDASRHYSDADAELLMASLMPITPSHLMLFSRYITLADAIDAAFAAAHMPLMSFSMLYFDAAMLDWCRLLSYVADCCWWMLMLRWCLRCWWLITFSPFSPFRCRHFLFWLLLWCFSAYFSLISMMPLIIYWCFDTLITIWCWCLISAIDWFSLRYLIVSQFRHFRHMPCLLSLRRHWCRHFLLILAAADADGWLRWCDCVGLSPSRFCQYYHVYWYQMPFLMPRACNIIYACRYFSIAALFSHTPLSAASHWLLHCHYATSYWFTPILRHFDCHHGEPDAACIVFIVEAIEFSFIIDAIAAITMPRCHWLMLPGLTDLIIDAADIDFLFSLRWYLFHYWRLITLPFADYAVDMCFADGITDTPFIFA